MSVKFKMQSYKINVLNGDPPPTGYRLCLQNKVMQNARPATFISLTITRGGEFHLAQEMYTTMTTLLVERL